MKSTIDIQCEYCLRCDAPLGKRFLILSSSRETRRFSKGGRAVLVEYHPGNHEFGRFCSERCADKHVQRIMRRDGSRLRKDRTADNPIETCAHCRKTFSMTNLHTTIELDTFTNKADLLSKWNFHETLAVIRTICMPQEEC